MDRCDRYTAEYRAVQAAFEKLMLVAYPSPDVAAFNAAKSEFDKAITAYDKAQEEWTADDIIKRSA